MSNPYIKAAANDLLKAAADKRTEEQDVRRQAQELIRQVDMQKRTKTEEINNQRKLIATDPTSPEVSQLSKRLHDAQDELNKLVPKETRSVEVMAEVAEATDVEHGVLQAVERHDADVVVLGRRGRGGIVAALMGSSARAVAGRSPRPVLLVPETPEDA